MSNDKSIEPLSTDLCLPVGRPGGHSIGHGRESSPWIGQSFNYCVCEHGECKQHMYERDAQQRTTEHLKDCIDRLSQQILIQSGHIEDLQDKCKNQQVEIEHLQGLVEGGDRDSGDDCGTASSSSYGSGMDYESDSEQRVLPFKKRRLDRN